MKILKLLLAFFILSTITTSCTPQALDDNQIINPQATGSEDNTVDDGSKD
ncbi:hypothetical protein [uncultured Psychroserpens sp.]|nr:hypothetical protein [uncultured Psychroserpens sp.]